MTPEQATALRKPFPPESIGQLPKGGVMLDYVGHAAVVDRLLTVDPAWTWEPFAVTPEGLPALDRAGNLWIRLTVCGVTRIGVGDGKSAKECIGDALRNASMRFGVALDLWAKEALVEFAHAAQARTRAPKQASGGGGSSEGEASEPTLPGVDNSPGNLAPGVEAEGGTVAVEQSEGGPPDAVPPAQADRGPRKATRATQKMIFATLGTLGVEDDEEGTERKYIASKIVGHTVYSFNDLSTAEASRIIDTLARFGSSADLYTYLDTLEDPS